MTDALLKLAVTKNYNKKIQERKIELEKKRRFKEIFMQYQKNTQKNNLLKKQRNNHRKNKNSRYNPMPKFHFSPSSTK